MDVLRYAIMNPDCRDGKHGACSGDGWNEALDKPTMCPCVCHVVFPGKGGAE